MRCQALACSHFVKKSKKNTEVCHSSEDFSGQLPRAYQDTGFKELFIPESVMSHLQVVLSHLH